MLTIDYFKKQLKDTRPISENKLRLMGNTTYHNGEKIQIGDNILFAYLKISSNTYDIIRLNERHFEEFLLLETSNIDESYMPCLEYK